MASPRKVLVTTRLFDDTAAHYLAERGLEVVRSGLAPDALDTDIADAELDRLLDGAGGWIVGMRAVTREVLARHPQLKVIARRGVGYERVDAAAAEELGRVVTIAAGANDAAVADHTMALMLAVLRRLRESQERLSAGDWRVVSGADLYGKTVGLVGFGRIARQVARRLHGFDVRVLVETPRPDFSVTSVTYATLPELLAASDVVSLHAPLTAATRHLLNGDTFALMKPGAVVVNTSRGGLVDDAALLEALRAGRLGGAGLDVFEAEGNPALRPVADALIARPDVVASAHAAGSSREALARGNLISAHCVASVLAGEDMPAGCVVADGR